MQTLFLSQDDAEMISESIDTYFHIDAGSQFARVLMIIISIFTVLGNVAVLLVTIRQKHLRAPSNFFIFNMAVIDFIYACIMLSTVPDQLANQRFAGGPDKCVIIAFGAMLGSGVSLFSLGLLGVDRYLTVVHKFEWRKWQLQVALFMSWFMTFCLVMICPLANHSSVYGMKSSGMYCLARFYDRHPAALVLIVAAILYICGTNVLIFLCYTSVLKTYLVARINTIRSRMGEDLLQNGSNSLTWSDMWYMFRHGEYRFKGTSLTSAAAQQSNSQLQSTALVRVDNNKSINKSTEVLSANNNSAQSLEWALFRKSATIFGAFNICWIPFIIGVFYELISGSEQPAWLDTIGILGAAASSGVNPLLNFALDARYRDALFQLFADLGIKM